MFGWFAEISSNADTARSTPTATVRSTKPRARNGGTSSTARRSPTSTGRCRGRRRKFQARNQRRTVVRSIPLESRWEVCECKAGEQRTVVAHTRIQALLFHVSCVLVRWMIRSPSIGARRTTVFLLSSHEQRKVVRMTNCYGVDHGK